LNKAAVVILKKKKKLAGVNRNSELKLQSEICDSSSSKEETSFLSSMSTYMHACKRKHNLYVMLHSGPCILSQFCTSKNVDFKSRDVIANDELQVENRHIELYFN
jgi:hypothetical protein